MKPLNTIWNAVLDTIFPKFCLACGERGVDLCEKCLGAFPRTERESAEWVFPLYDYRHPPIRKSIKLLKYKRHKNLARVFAENLYPTILEELSELKTMENFREPFLVPIPLSRRRLRQRGFNQAELICEELIRLDVENNLRYSIDDASANFTLEKNVLLKPKETPHQADIKDRQARLRNIIGSFAVSNGEKITKRNIILIDDVTTTGATLHEAKKVLKEAGARRVIAFTVAH